MNAVFTSAARTLAAAALFPGCRLFDAPSPRKPDRDTTRFVWSLPGYTNSGLPFFQGGTVFFLGFSHEVTAVRSSDGHLLWSVRLPVDHPRTIGDGGVAVDDKVIVGDGDIFALRASSGEILWRFSPAQGVNVGRLVPVVWNGSVLSGSSNGYVFAADIETGGLRWTTRLGTSDRLLVYAAPVLDGTLYVTTVDFDSAPNGEPQGGIAALDAVTGDVKWSRPIPHHIDPTGPTASITPVVTGFVVVAGARDGPVYGFDRETGDVRWKIPPFPFPHVGDPALIRDVHWLASCNGFVYVGSSSTLVLAIDPETGTEQWRTPKSLSSAEPVWCDSRSVFVMRPLGGIEVLNWTDGTRRWELRVPEYDFFFGAVSDGNRLYMGGREGVYALRNE